MVRKVCCEKIASFLMLSAVFPSFLLYALYRQRRGSELPCNPESNDLYVWLQEAARIDEEEYSFHGIHTVDFPVPGGPVITIILPRSILLIPSTSCFVHFFTTIQ